MIMMRPRTDP